ncbi:hypothetical protein D6C83_02690 [Aureobasidium pullulans]|uniref:Uncharacterized protein n=1 Tax=Aureobasidium pullulans TaxID=5580 RepID=A0A4T0DQ93_AURPU|nr:hypothetical protein D6C83_02690 [Aureobasidium pullulans]
MTCETSPLYKNISRPHTSKTFIHVGRQTFWSSANRARIGSSRRQILEKWYELEDRKFGQLLLLNAINTERRKALKRHPELRNKDNLQFALDESARLLKTMGEYPAESTRTWPKHKLVEFYNLELKLLDAMAILYNDERAAKDLDKRMALRTKARKVLFLLEHGDSPMSRIIFRMFYQDASVAVNLYCITLFTFALIVVKTFYKTAGQRTNRGSQEISRVSRPGNV